jgi:hypothetical protein
MQPPISVPLSPDSSVTYSSSVHKRNTEALAVVVDLLNGRKAFFQSQSDADSYLASLETAPQTTPELVDPNTAVQAHVGRNRSLS